MYLLLLILILTSCEKDLQNKKSASTFWQEIKGRDEGLPADRPFVYRALIPMHWIRKDPSSFDSIMDTTKAICEFYIEEPNDKIRITVHNFPFYEVTQRVPPQAQILRWKNQFAELDPTLTLIKPSAHGGFVGLYLEAQGVINDQPIKMLGWSMQLASDYIWKMALENQVVDRQRRADYTIKAYGSPQAIDKHKKSILAFANSFELIDELPSPL